MKIPMASTPATGHVNPVLAIARIMMTEKHEVAIYIGSAFRVRGEAAGAELLSLQPDADLDPADPFARFPELKVLPPGPDWLRVAMERVSSTIFRLNTRACKGSCMALVLTSSLATICSLVYYRCC
jgi:UDP:flavonoid glycosyltransferase YjiC (YdhE family)